MKSLWSQITSSKASERMMIAIANNRIDGVKAEIANGVTGRTRAHHPVMYPGKISMFSYACFIGNAEAAQRLYSPGQDLEESRDLRITPLMAACNVIKSPKAHEEFDEDPQDLAEVARAEQLIRWLVDRGADVNGRVQDHTVMHCAATGCSYEIVSFLIARGAKIDSPADDDFPPFVMAARDSNLPALKALAEHGADINRPCGVPWAKGLTALGVLELERSKGFDKPEVIAYLRSIGAKERP